MMKILIIVQINDHQLDILSTQIPEMYSLTVDNLNFKLKEIRHNYPFIIPGYLKV